MKKRARQQKTCPGPSWFYTRILITSCWNVHKSQAKTPVRGPPCSTIIIFKEIIRFNNNNNNNNNNHLTHGPPRFLPTRSSSRRGLPPPLRGGNSSFKESPALPIPSYPALCREDTTSWIDGRPSTPNMTSSCRGLLWSDRKLIDLIACKLHIFGRAGGSGRGGRVARSKLQKMLSSYKVYHNWKSWLGFIKCTKVYHVGQSLSSLIKFIMFDKDCQVW